MSILHCPFSFLLAAAPSFPRHSAASRYSLQKTRFGVRPLACPDGCCCWVPPTPPVQSPSQTRTAAIPSHPIPAAQHRDPSTSKWSQHAGWALVLQQYPYLQPLHSPRPCRQQGGSPSRPAIPMSLIRPCEPPQSPSMASRRLALMPRPCERSRTASLHRQSARWSSVEWPRRHAPGPVAPSPTAQLRGPQGALPPRHTRPRTRRTSAPTRSLPF